MKPPGAPGLRPVFWFLLAAYLVTASGHLYLGDTWSMERTAESVLTRGELSIEFEPAFGGKFGPDGRFYAKYGVGVLAHMLAPAAVGRALAATLDPAKTGKRRLATGLPASLVNAPFAALAGAMFFGIALRLGYRPRAALWTTLALAFGTTLWVYARHDAFEPQLTGVAMAAVYLAFTGSPLAAGLAAGWAMTVKPVAVLVMVPLAVYVWREGGAAAVARFAVGPAVAVAVIAGYDWLRFGNPLETGYSAEVQAYTIPLLVGAYGLLLSAGKGVFWFSPALLVALCGSTKFKERHPREWGFVAAVFVIHVLFYGVQQSWDGDWCWGPRYLLPCVPLLMLWALPVFERPPDGWRQGALAITMALAVFVQVLGIAVDPSDYMRWLSENKVQLGDFLHQPAKIYVPLHPHHWNPDLSPLRGHLHLLGDILAGKPSAMPLYASIEERNDRSGHRLEEVQALPPTTRLLMLDLWLPIFSGITQGSRWFLPVWLLFTVEALLLVKTRRRLWREVRLAEQAD